MHAYTASRSKQYRRTAPLIVERRIWSKEKSTDWWNRTVVEFNDEEWRENFRMSRTLFNYLCSELREQIERQDTRLRCAIPVDRRVAITLWRLATNADYRSTGHIFGVAKGTCL